MGGRDESLEAEMVRRALVLTPLFAALLLAGPA
jgi:hypothetical protein